MSKQPSSPASASLEFTGERFVPWLSGEIAYEHWHRYAFAQRFVAGRRVLDAACGEGYGTALLAKSAAQAIGLDVDPAAIAHARAAYAGRPRLQYERGSVAAIPLPDASVDVVVSFETIEHLPAADQPAMIAEFERVLAPGGLLLISSPNKKVYSDDTGYSNPFHLHELYRDGFADLLAARFPHQRWFRQARLVASAIWEEGAGGSVEALTGDGRDAEAMPVPEGMYFVTAAAKSAAALPDAVPALSVYVDRDDSERKLALQNALDVPRLDALALERNETHKAPDGPRPALGGTRRLPGSHHRRTGYRTCGNQGRARSRPCGDRRAGRRAAAARSRAGGAAAPPRFPQLARRLAALAADARPSAVAAVDGAVITP